MAITVGFVSEKGGVGKTTACYHIAVGLRRYHEKRLLVVDADYQRGGISCRFLPEMIEHFRGGRVPGRTLFDTFQRLYVGESPAPEVDLVPTPEGVDLLPADPRLAQVSVDKLPASNNIRENNRRLWAHLRVLQQVLEPHAGRYDYTWRIATPNCPTCCAPWFTRATSVSLRSRSTSNPRSGCRPPSRRSTKSTTTWR